MNCPSCGTDMKLVEEPLHDHWECPWCSLTLPLDEVIERDIEGEEDEDIND